MKFRQLVKTELKINNKMKFNIIALILCFFLVATAFTDAKAIKERIEIKTTIYPKSTSAEDNSLEDNSLEDNSIEIKSSTAQFKIK